MTQEEAIVREPNLKERSILVAFLFAGVSIVIILYLLQNLLVNSLGGVYAISLYTFKASFEQESYEELLREQNLAGWHEETMLQPAEKVLKKRGEAADLSEVYDDFMGVLYYRLRKAGIYPDFFQIRDKIIKKRISQNSLPECGCGSGWKIQGFPQYRGEEYLLAQIIYCEAGGESEMEMWVTGSVVLNRARTDYPQFAAVDTIIDVLYQGDGTSNQQYSRITINKIESGIVPSGTAQEIARNLISGKLKCVDEDVLYQTHVYPTWGVEVRDFGLKQFYASPRDFWDFKAASAANKETKA